MSHQIDEEILDVVEVLLTASPEPLNQARFNQVMQHKEIRLSEVVAKLRARIEQQRRPVEIMSVAGGFQLVTNAEYLPYLQRLFRKAGTLSLTRAALETLAVVAYHQPATRSEIEQIRGVNSDSVLRSLWEKDLVVIKGRDDSVGRPLLYGTTPAFLEALGLPGLGDLPKLKEIKEIMGTDGAPGSVENAAE